MYQLQQFNIKPVLYTDGALGALGSIVTLGSVFGALGVFKALGSLRSVFGTLEAVVGLPSVQSLQALQVRCSKHSIIIYCSTSSIHLKHHLTYFMKNLLRLVPYIAIILN